MGTITAQSGQVGGGSRVSLLLTRPEGSSLRLLGAVESALGAAVPAVISPVIAITPLADHWDGEPVGGLVLSSEHGAEMAGRMGFPAGLPAYCVGDQTARTAAARGFAAVSAAGDADDLVALILGRSPKGPLVHLRGDHARGNIAARLNEAGLPCSERVVYAQTAQRLTPAARELLSGPGIVLAPLFSPRSAALLAGQGPFAATLHIVAISAAVAAAAAPLAPASVVIAAQPEGPAMVAAIVGCLKSLNFTPSA
jgi:uroporphyrinogen-III synthase